MIFFHLLLSLVHLLLKRLPFGRFSNQEELKQWESDIVNKTLKAWSIERIEHEWIIRLNYLREWMETAEETI